MEPSAVEPEARRLIAENRNLLVPWYLMLSFLYYLRDVSVVSDALYDDICRRLDAEWDLVVHIHKSLIDRTALKAGTCFHLRERDYPTRVRSAAMRLAETTA